jgi:hypothetical protein
VELLERWEKYAKAKMADRIEDIMSVEKQKDKTKLLTLCHGDCW